MSKFQLILLIVFGVFIVVAVMLFSFSRGRGPVTANVTIWGPMSAYEWSAFTTASGINADRNLFIQYKEVAEESIGEEFTEALAEGRGPDLIILSQESFWKERNKLYLIPFDTISERTFKSTFIEEGELFINKALEGIYALPFAVDPMVLYYNRDLLTAGGFAKPIEYWDEIYNAAAKLTQKDAAGNITRSTIALGEARNIPHFKEILSLLSLQAGTPITLISNGELRSVFGSNFDLPLVPGEAALDFYTQFSNPTKSFYSWNRSSLPAQVRFTSGDTAYYLGFASELKELENKNPNLNFAIAPVPQSRVSGKRITYGKLSGLAVVKGSGNEAAALRAAMKLVSRDSIASLSKTVGLPPVRRDLLVERQSDEVNAVFYDSALQARGWLDPDRERTEAVFRDMVESVTSGRARTGEAVNKAAREIEDIIK